MVDFKKMKSSKKAPTVINPVELFRRMPKPKGVNDLYSSQIGLIVEPIKIQSLSFIPEGEKPW